MLNIKSKEETLVIEFKVQVIEINESISGTNDVEFRNFLKEETNDGNCKRLLIDLTNMRFINSSGLGAIANLSMKMRKHGGTLVVLSPNREVTQVFEITKLEQVLNIVKDKDSALKLFA